MKQSGNMVIKVADKNIKVKMALMYVALYIILLALVYLVYGGFNNIFWDMVFVWAVFLIFYFFMTVYRSYITICDNSICIKTFRYSQHNISLSEVRNIKIVSKWKHKALLISYGDNGEVFIYPDDAEDTKRLIEEKLQDVRS